MRYLCPYEKRHSGIETGGHVDRAVRRDASQRGTAVGDCQFAAQLLDRAEAIEMSAPGEGFQIESSRELTVHDRLALRADEPELITRAPSRCRAVGSSAAAGHADSKRPASPAAGDAQAGLQKIAAPDHRVASPVTSLRPQLAPSCSPRLGPLPSGSSEPVCPTSVKQFTVPKKIYPYRIRRLPEDLVPHLAYVIAAS